MGLALFAVLELTIMDHLGPAAPVPMESRLAKVHIVAYLLL